MDWKKYHRLNVIYSFIDELEKDFPAICTVSVIGKSVQGRDIKVVKYVYCKIIVVRVLTVKISTSYV